MKKIFLILFVLLCAVSAVAQEATVKSFEAAPMDLTAQRYSRLDRHGVKCAVVKVRVIADGVAFQGNVMGEPVEKPGEYWVYMTDGTKMLQILSSSFLPLMFDFPEPLQSGVTYLLTLQAPQFGGAKSMPTENFLVLKVKPANAHVYVDGTERAVEDGVVSIPLANGIHTFRAEAVGYAPVEESVTMNGQRVSRNINLVSNKATLTVSAVTPGTEIYVNEKRKGTDRWTGSLVAGDYIVEGRHNGYRNNSQKVALEQGSSRSVVIPALTPIIGSLTVNYKPVDATITIDGQPAGVTPNIINDLQVGTHRVEIASPGYTTAILSATVTEGTPVTLTGSLSPVPVTKIVTLPETDAELNKKYKSFKDEKTGKHGFKYNGEIVIPARYDYLGNSGFNDGLIAVGLNGKSGFIDRNGNLVIPAIYDSVWKFNNGKAKVKLGGREFYIDRNGNEISASGTSSLTNTTTTYDPNYERFKDPQTEKWGFKYNGKIVIPTKYDMVWGFREGLALVELNGKNGYIDKNGVMVIPAIYNGAGNFSEGLAGVEINGKWGKIDKKGNLVIPAIYDSCSQFKDGKSKVFLNGREFYIDRNGNEVNASGVPVARAAALSDADVALSHKYTRYQDPGTEKWGFKYKGDVVIPAIYEFVGISGFNEGLSAAKLNGKWGFIDKNATMVIPNKYDGVITAFNDGKAQVRIGDRKFFIDRHGNEVK